MKYETRTTLRLTEELKKKLLREAEKENRNLHNMILTILIRYFDSHPD